MAEYNRRRYASDGGILLRSGHSDSDIRRIQKSSRRPNSTGIALVKTKKFKAKDSTSERKRSSDLSYEKVEKESRLEYYDKSSATRSFATSNLSGLSVEGLVAVFKKDSELHANVLTALDEMKIFKKKWLRPKQLVESQILNHEGEHSLCQNRLYKSVDMGLTEVAQDLVKEKRRLSAEIERLRLELNHFDALGMMGKATFQESLADFEENMRNGKQGSLICIQCFNFSVLRRKHGNDAIPTILQAIGDGLQKCVDETSKCFLYHLDGDQFAVIARLDTRSQLQKLVTQLIDAGSVLVDINNSKTSAGIVCGAVIGQNVTWSEAVTEADKARENVMEDPRDAYRYSIFVKKVPSFTTGIVQTRSSWRANELRHEAKFMNHMGRNMEAAELLMQFFKQEETWLSEDRELLLSTVKQLLNESLAKVDQISLIDSPDLNERLTSERDKILLHVGELIEALELVVKTFVLTSHSEHASPGSWHHTEYLWFHKFLFQLATFTHQLSATPQNMKNCDIQARKMESLILKEHPCSSVRLNWAYDYANWLVKFDAEEAVKNAKLMKMEAQSNLDTTSSYDDMVAASEWIKKINDWLKNIDYLVNEVVSPIVISTSGATTGLDFSDATLGMDSINLNIDNI